MLVLFATVSVIVKPYYEIQRDIDRILLHMEQQTQYQEGNRSEINELEVDVSTVVKAVHTLLRIQSGEKIDRQELERLIEQFEGTLIYDNSSDRKTTDSGQAEIDRITQETLEALRKLQ